MWPLPTIREQYIHIVMEQNALHCYLIKGKRKDKPTCIADKRYIIQTISDDLLYNLKSIQEHINDFIHKHTITNAYTCYIFATPFVQQFLIEHHNGHAALDDLIKVDNRHMHYNYCYLGMGKTNHLYYVCSISASLIFQLHVIHTGLPLYLHTIKPPLAVELTLYQHLHKKEIPQAHLIQIIDKEHIEIPHLFSDTIINSILADNYKTDHLKTLVYALASHIGVCS